jgi:hypothetical protein
MGNDSTETKHLHVRPKLLNSPNNQLASSWPRLPQIALTTHDNVLEPLSSKDSQQEYPENENVNITELLTPYNEKNDQESYFDDVESIESKQPSLESTTSLVEAALDKAEAKDRHVRFHDHVAESAALVQRMISVKRGNHFPNEEIPSIKKRYESDILLEENNSDDNTSSPIVGGSVLASLMKLEATHQHSKKEKKKTQYKSKKVAFKKNKKSIEQKKKRVIFN